MAKKKKRKPFWEKLGIEIKRGKFREHVTEIFGGNNVFSLRLLPSCPYCGSFSFNPEFTDKELKVEEEGELRAWTAFCIDMIKDLPKKEREEALRGFKTNYPELMEEKRKCAKCGKWSKGKRQKWGFCLKNDATGKPYSFEEIMEEAEQEGEKPRLIELEHDA